MPGEQEEEFLNSFVQYLSWKLAGGKPETEPPKPTETFAALLDALMKALPQKNPEMRAALMRSMKALQESAGRVIT